MEIPRTSIAAPAQADDPPAPPRVVVVDDSAAQRRLLSAVLTRAGYEVVSARDAAAALDLLDRSAPAIVVCDWMMPGLSGPEFCARVREMALDRYIYILILTSISDKAATAHALDVGADDFLTKPVGAPELKARVRAGQRIIEMQDQVLERNRLLTRALAEIQELYEALDRDLVQARQLQRALLPTQGLSGDWGGAGFFLGSAGKVGGDLVGHFPAGPGRIGFFSLDVSGHGVTSALLTARLAGLFSNSAPEQNVAVTRGPEGDVVARDPAGIAAEINRQLLSEIDTELYLTLCVAVLETDTGAVELVQAGHPHPLHGRAEGGALPVGTGGMPVGLLYDAGYETVRLQLAPGDRLLLHSDGFTECPGQDGAMLGEAGLAQMFGRLPPGDPSAALDLLVADLARFAGTHSFPDDLSAILIDYGGAGTGSAQGET